MTPTTQHKFTELRLAVELIGQSILHDEYPTWANHLAVCDAVGNAERQMTDLLAALEDIMQLPYTLNSRMVRNVEIPRALVKRATEALAAVKGA